MSTRNQPAIIVAQWCCHLCDVVTEPVAGLYADAEAAQLATVHDQVHHRGARTAQSLVIDVIEVNELTPAASPAEAGADGVADAIAVGDTVVTVSDNVLSVPAGAWGPQAAAS